jgi:hypothetical protein
VKSWIHGRIDRLQAAERLQLLMRVLYRPFDRGVRLLVRILQSEPAGAVVARIDHGTDDVDMLRDPDEILPDALRGRNRCGIAENIDRYADSQRFKLLPRILDETAYDIDPALVGSVVRKLVCPLLEALRKTDIVELDFLESELCRFLGHCQVVLPHLAAVRIDEAFAAPVLPYGPVGLAERQVGTLPGEDGVLEHNDARDRVDLVGLQSVHQRRHVLDDLLRRAELGQFRIVRRPGDVPVVVLHVDDHRVQVGAADKLEQLLHARAAGAVGCDVDAFDFRRAGLGIGLAVRISRLVRSGCGRVRSGGLRDDLSAARMRQRAGKLFEIAVAGQHAVQQHQDRKQHIHGFSAPRKLSFEIIIIIREFCNNPRP